ncbi:MAG: SusD/RagB family nutrient-binding outer membrane lipoprotein [Bacteroidota bacterium]|nr:SusD/RagB family nutrient-binding outer membrane lipoprotein [Bacteroidota bacterium]
MKKILLQMPGLLIWLLAGFCAVSCTKNFDKINTNPNTLTRGQLNYDNTYVSAFIVQMEKCVFPVANQPNYGDEEYQIEENLAGDIFSGQQGASNNWFGGSNSTTYNLIPGWYAAAFNNANLNIMAPWLFIKKNVRATNPDVFAVATIMKVVAMQRITDMYGPLPYLKAGTTGLFTNYDSQQQIYQSFFAELDTARSILENFVQKNSGATPLAKYDAIYAGNYTEWIKLANSLRLRLAMRIVYANPSLAQQNAEDAIKDQYGVMTATADNAAFVSYQGILIHNPLDIITHSFNDVRMGATMESFLKGYNDPRISRYFQSAPDGNYHGIRTGIFISDRTPYYTNNSALNVQPGTSLPWMNASEVYFLRTEGALRGWNMNGTAKALYNSGISQAFSESGAGNASNYFNDATSVAAPYTDVVNSSNSFTTGMSTITIQWNDSAPFETSLERIITQKWIALFPDGQEAWSEFRRTGYPKIFPVIQNDSQGAISTTVQIRRLPYPQSEYNTNAAGVKTGVALLNGPDNGGTKLWWDKK